MSLILDALNKADNERSKNSPPSLNSNHDTAVDNTSSKHSNKIILILCIITIILVVAVVLLFLKSQVSENQAKPRLKQSVPTVSQSKRPSATPANTLNKEKQQSIAFAPEKKTPTSGTQEKQKETKKYEEIKQRLIEAQYEKANQEPEKKPVKSAAKNKTQISSIYQQNKAQQNTPTDSAAAGNTTQANTVKTSINDFDKIGKIRDLPQSIQQDIPTIMYSVHNYNASRSSVTLNNKKRSKGQLVSGQLYIEEILKDGVILRYKGHKFKMAALSSWVNL
ncbi:general secretion pathway protein GspB [Agarilytica rhodophyticola]|uniref:general secretion pathway protein GspB n=1 Tax=Agarilytica rhodophyticola TaxID=1737490 RepID=UPI000B342AB6|nr:general secretion pathway protein GspB [Agarilytica rhodophyticola]